MTLSSLPSRDYILGPLLFLAIGIALFSSPSVLAKTYVAVLKSPGEVYDRVQITNPDGVFGFVSPGFGTYVDRAFISVPRVSDELINSQFGPALEIMKTILAAGLPPLSHSYVALLESKEGNLGSIHVDINSSAAVLDKANQAVLIDGFSSEPFNIEASQLASDFGPAMETLIETRLAGLVPRTYVVLLESPDGSVGKVNITDARGSVLIEQAGQAVNLDVQTASITPFMADQAQVVRDFGAAIEARPPLPADFTLFFESGSTQLTADSGSALENLLKDLRGRPAPNIIIKGHTDTVGDETRNEELSRARAESIANQIRSLNAAIVQLEVLALGEISPLVPTPDNTREVKNRRVEVHVW